jgi:hypothetical protein
VQDVHRAEGLVELLDLEDDLAARQEAQRPARSAVMGEVDAEVV